MECQLRNGIVWLVTLLSKGMKRHRNHFTDALIVIVYDWSVIHDRPVSWACQRRHWPLWWRQPIPSNSTMSRRLKAASVRLLLHRVERELNAPKFSKLFWMIDGKPLSIGGCSKDHQAGYGRSSGGKAKGYKLHAIMGSDGEIPQWRLAPLNTDERVMAARMLKVMTQEGYLIADSNYDSNPLHQMTDQRGDRLHLIIPRRGGPGRGLGHHRHAAGRLRSREILECSLTGFGEQLLQARIRIEQQFGHLSSWGGGLICLPPWVRTYHRVYRWVQAKLALQTLRKACLSKTYGSS